MKKVIFLGFSVFTLFQCREVRNSEVKVEAKNTDLATEQSPEKAKVIAMEVQVALGKTLQEKMRQEGVAGAIAFCNVNALPITDSISRKYGVKVQRITDRERNTANRANQNEIALMNRIRDSILSGAQPGNLTLSELEEVSYYSPIVTADLCLKCHGTLGKEVNPNDYEIISRYYPEDRAIGYGASELRGLWKVTYNSK
jgi:hypothetical protein